MCSSMTSRRSQSFPLSDVFGVNFTDSYRAPFEPLRLDSPNARCAVPSASKSSDDSVPQGRGDGEHVSPQMLSGLFL